MIKRGSRNCDRCKKKMELKETKKATKDIFNFVSLGWKNDKGRTLAKNIDLCPDCMNKLNEFLFPEQRKTE